MCVHISRPRRGGVGYCLSLALVQWASARLAYQASTPRTGRDLRGLPRLAFNFRLHLRSRKFQHMHLEELYMLDNPLVPPSALRGKWHGITILTGLMDPFCAKVFAQARSLTAPPTT